MKEGSSLLGILPRMYGFARKAGVLEWPGARTAYRWAYFAYKKHLEDPFDAFCRNHPEFFTHGHVLDVGANVGYTAWVFSQALSRAGSSAKVYAFEPEAENFSALARLSAKGNASTHLLAIRSAVGERTGELDLWINEGHNADHRVLTPAFRDSGQASGRLERVEVVALDDFCRERGIDRQVGFVKIDVQGYEPAVCRGMSKILELNPGIRVALEVDPNLIRTLGEDDGELHRFFSERGFRFWSIRRNGSLVPLQSLNESDIRAAAKEKGYLDVLCSRGKEIS